MHVNELVEANFSNLALDDRDVTVIGTHLSSKIVRLNLKGLWEFSDENIQNLVVYRFLNTSLY